MGESSGNGAPSLDEWEADTPDVSDVEALRRAWRNEKLSPELLHFQSQLVSRVREQIALLEDNLNAYAAEEANDELMLSLYRMDLDRTLFLVRSYLRARLAKIEKFVLHALEVSDVSSKLSDQEYEYAQRYAAHLKTHFDLSVLTKLPEGYQSMLQQAIASDENDMSIQIIKLLGFLIFTVVEPSLDTFVFCKARQPISAIQLDDKGEETVSMTTGDLYILNYRPVKRLLETDRIELH